MSANETLAARIAEPVFEGFFLQLVLPDMEQRAREGVVENLGAGWELKPIGDASTQFEVFQPRRATEQGHTLSVKQVWETTYRLRSAPGVVDAEPLFGVPLPERPIHNVGEFSTEAAAAFSLNEHVPESDDAHWSLNEMHVFQAWAEFFPDKLPGQGIIIGHPDTGYRKHPEIFAMPSTAFALESHVPVDSGGLSTFTHLFQTKLPHSSIEGAFTAPDSSNARLRSKLAQLLRVTEAELPSRLKEVGQELAFHFTVNPDLYNSFAAALSTPEPDPAARASSANAVSSAEIEAIRNELLEKNASDALKMKIS